MARGRVITPEFWVDGNMVGVSAFARLFYIGLWNFAYCDEGHLPDDAVGLKLKVLPADDVDVEALLGELMARERVVRVGAEGRTFLFMPRFKLHQKADPRWKTRCPACALQDSLKLIETPESLSEHSGTLQSSALTEEERNRENRRGEKRTPAPSALDELFDVAWSRWPKKTERKAAHEKFLTTVKRFDDPYDLSDSIILFGNAYGQTTEKRFVPALSVWLGHERWTDELPQARTGSRSKDEQIVDVLEQGRVMLEQDNRKALE